MRVLAVAVVAAVALAQGGCDDSDGLSLSGSPEASDRAPDGREWRQVKTVRKFGPSHQLTRDERRRGRQIVATDASLAPLLRDAGGHAVTSVVPLTPVGASALVGAFVELTLTKPITGSYRLPSECVDLEGQFVHVEPIEYRFEGIDALMVSVSFAEGAVFEASPGIDTRGDYQIADEPKTWPRSCEEAAKRGIGS